MTKNCCGFSTHHFTVILAYLMGLEASIPGQTGALCVIAVSLRCVSCCALDKESALQVLVHYIWQHCFVKDEQHRVSLDEFLKVESAVCLSSCAPRCTCESRRPWCRTLISTTPTRYCATCNCSLASVHAEHRCYGRAPALLTCPLTVAECVTRLAPRYQWRRIHGVRRFYENAV